MTFFGLEPAAQVVVLQGASTYAALASAYFFARPVLRGQAVQSSRELLSGVRSPDADVAELVEEANAILTRRAQAEQPLTRRSNRWGVACLAVSFLLFTAALARQIETDPNLQAAVPSALAPARP